MDKASEIKLSIFEAYENGQITDSEKEKLMLALEGANIDLMKIYQDDVHAANKHLKEAKKAMRSGDYKEAVKQFEESIKKAKEIKTVVKGIDETSAEKFIGIFAFLWKDYIAQIISIGSFVIGGLVAKKSVSNIAHFVKQNAPAEPNTFFDQTFNWNTHEWELTPNGVKKMEKYASDVAKYEENLGKVVAKNKGKLVAGGLLYGIGIALQIAKFVQTVIAIAKMIQGSKKLLEQDMDKEHWDRMVTKTYNPMKAYIFQLCDDYITIAERSIKKIKEVEKDAAKAEKEVKEYSLENFDENLAVLEATTMLFEEGYISSEKLFDICYTL